MHIISKAVAALLFTACCSFADDVKYDHTLTWSYWNANMPKEAFSEVEFIWDGKSLGFGISALHILNKTEVKAGNRILINLPTAPNGPSRASLWIAEHLYTEGDALFIFRWANQGVILTHCLDGKRYETHSLIPTHLIGGVENYKVLFDGKNLGSDLEAAEILKNMQLSEPGFILYFRPSLWWQQWAQRSPIPERAFETLRDREGEGKLYFGIINVDDIEYLKYVKSAK